MNYVDCGGLVSCLTCLYQMTHVRKCVSSTTRSTIALHSRVAIYWYIYTGSEPATIQSLSCLAYYQFSKLIRLNVVYFLSHVETQIYIRH